MREKAFETAVGIACLIVSLLVQLSQAAAASPSQLYGKSIVVSWMEARSHNGQGRGVLLHPVISVYVSTAGRTFTRIFVERGSRRYGLSRSRGGGTASAEQGPGEGQLGGAKVHRADFAGHSLIMTSVFQSGARQISVDFDSAFTSCQAKVLHGKEAGQQTMRHTSLFGSHTVEISSIEVSGVTCAVQQGNVFTNS
jgi:hypothetical protein